MGEGEGIMNDWTVAKQRKAYADLGGVKYTRVEVIAEKGNDYVDWCEYWAVEQDGGRTLKLFKILPEVRTEIE
jgi:hypothetical protein